ncbi:MAG TPA: helix-turn-helix transcriptional regulator [Pseudobdellovibrionaceae bacterium]|nr:helix-turn-helix transcriptional regulator [Pseudobdellovibrionaceae bacterium]
MKDAIIVQFDIQEPGRHCIVSAEKLSVFAGTGSQPSLKSLAEIVGMDSIVGLILKTHRNRLNLTTEQLATKSRVSTASINRIEKGLKAMSSDDLNFLEKELSGLRADLSAVGIGPK